MHRRLAAQANPRVYHRFARRFSTTLAAGWLVAAAPVQALPVDPSLPDLMTATTSCGSNLPHIFMPTHNGTFGVACDGYYSSPVGVITGEAEATVFGAGGSAYVNVSASGHVRGTSGATITALASAATFFSISTSTPPPGAAPFIPLLARMTADFDVSGNAGGEAFGYIDRLLVFKFVTATGDSGRLSFDETRTQFFAPDGALHTVWKNAACVAIPYTEMPEASCVGSADPMLSFDQATFDRMMGASTFVLADYYTIQVSANLVPEPRAWALMAMGLLALVPLARRSFGRQGFYSGNPTRPLPRAAAARGVTRGVRDELLPHY